MVLLNRSIYWMRVAAKGSYWAVVASWESEESRPGHKSSHPEGKSKKTITELVGCKKHRKPLLIPFSSNGKPGDGCTGCTNVDSRHYSKGSGCGRFYCFRCYKSACNTNISKKTSWEEDLVEWDGKPWLQPVIWMGSLKTAWGRVSKRPQSSVLSVLNH